jgi:hypothetical protein
MTGELNPLKNGSFWVAPILIAFGIRKLRMVDKVSHWDWVW